MVSLVPEPLTVVSPVNVFAPESVVEPWNATLPAPEITPLEAPPEILTVAPLDTAMFPPSRFVTLVVPEVTFTVPALDVVMVPPFDKVNVPPETVPTLPPLESVNVPPETVPIVPPAERVKSPEDNVVISEVPESDNVPVLKFVTFTFPDIVPEAVNVPIVAKSPSVFENLVSPLPESESSDTVDPLKIKGVVPEALFATAPNVTFPLKVARPFPLRLSALPALNPALEVKSPPVPTAIPPVKPDTVADPTITVPPMVKSPAPERLPLKVPAFTVNCLPDAMATVPPFKLLIVAFAFAVSVPVVNVVMAFVLPFSVTVPPLTEVMVLLLPLRVKLPPERVPSVRAPATFVVPSPDRVPKFAAPVNSAVAPADTDKLFPFFSEPDIVSVPAVTEVSPV
jgi:hypothetical protein